METVDQAIVLARLAQQAAKYVSSINPSVMCVVAPWPTTALGFVAGAYLAELERVIVVFQLAPRVIDFGSEGLAVWQEAARRGAVLVAVSKHDRRTLAQSMGLSYRRVRLIRNRPFISAVHRHLSRVERDTIRRDLRDECGWERDSQVVLTVARLSPEKRHRDLLEVASEWRTKMPSTKFLWAGTGPCWDTLSGALRARGMTESVVMLGHRTDVARLICGADVFCLPSELEGLPFALGEALAYACPVVAAENSGAKEILRHGKWGLLYPSGNTARLGAALLWSLENIEEARSIAESASREYAEEDGDRMCGSIVKVIEEDNSMQRRIS